MIKFEKLSGFSVKIISFLTAVFVGFASCQSSSQQVISGASSDMTSVYQASPEEKSEQANDQKNNPRNKKTNNTSESTPIKVEKKNTVYFGSISKDVMDEMQIASPAGISRGLNKMRKAEIEYTESEKVLYNITSRLMTLVWSREAPLTDVPELNSVSAQGNNYLALIDSASKGVFEERKGEKDFFMTVLPALVVLSSSTNTDNYAKAEAALNAGLKIKRDSVLCNYLLGVLYKKQKQYEKALEYFDKATESNTVVFEILFEKSDVLIKLGRYDAVTKILDRLIVQYPSDIQILKLYAMASFEVGDYAKAESFASQVLQQNPSDLEFVLFRAKIFVETGEYLKASSLLDVYAKTYPTQHEYLLLRAKLQKEWNKNISAAVTTIEKAISLYPKDSDIILYAAQLASETGYKISGRTGGQLADIILAKDPENIKGLQYSVQSSYNEANYAQAYSVSKKLMSVQNVPQSAVLMHIKVCLALKYNDEAWRYAAGLYERNPDDVDIIQYYIEVMIAIGRTQSASKLINSMLSANPSAILKSFLYYERSFLTSNESTMLSDLRSSLISNPRNSDALFRMYQIYFKRKDYRKAQYYLKQVVSLNPNDETYLRLNKELDQLVK